MLEQIFRAKWIEKTPSSAFKIGLIYSVIGILTAYIIFPESTGMMSLAFITILLLPSLNNLLTIEENEDVREKKFSLKLLFKDHWDIIKVYLFLFLGVILVYFILSNWFDNLLVQGIFKFQLNILGISGNATSTAARDFLGYLSNNFKVLIIFFILSIVYGAGSILFLIWNASVWGVIFGYALRNMLSSPETIVSFFIVLGKILPHTILEAGAYFLAIIGGGIISKAALREKYGTKKFDHVLTDGLIFLGMSVIVLILAAFLEAYWVPLLM